MKKSHNQSTDHQKFFARSWHSKEEGALKREGPSFPRSKGLPNLSKASFYKPKGQGNLPGTQGSKGSLFPNFSKVSFLAEAQMARQKAILFTKSAMFHTKFRELSFTPPSKYPKK